MNIQNELQNLKSRVENRERELQELKIKHSQLLERNTNLEKRIEKIDKKTKIKPVYLKEVSTSLTQRIFTESIKAAIIMIVTIQVNKWLAKEKVEKKIKKVR